MASRLALHEEMTCTQMSRSYTILYLGLFLRPNTFLHSMTQADCRLFPMQQEERPRLEHGRYVYRFLRSPMCEYMKSFIAKLLQLPRRDLMNSVLENFTILQWNAKSLSSSPIDTRQHQSICLQLRLSSRLGIKAILVPESTNLITEDHRAFANHFPDFLL
ncbi:unnamed protein product [Protopolystoma xenopodis]|uniref:YAP binding domain-containing protein n=1 Tax=Protopolystoma xenopodis TaxID=117903 RepID=A0A448WG51_9PLAT|nr:unnamed protein product [Protopolystoma xenopodis]